MTPKESEPKHSFQGEHTTPAGEGGKVPYEKPGVPKGEAYGIAAVTQALEGLDFPASREQVLAKIKNHEKVSWTKERRVNLRVIFDRVDQDRFESMAGVIHAVSEAARDEGITE